MINGMPQIYCSSSLESPLLAKVGYIILWIQDVSVITDISTFLTIPASDPARISLLFWRMPSSLEESLSIGRIGHGLASFLAPLYIKQRAWELEGFAVIPFTRDRIHGTEARDRIHGMEDVIMIKLAST
jgi:hypothetical protein